MKANKRFNEFMADVGLGPGLKTESAIEDAVMLFRLLRPGNRCHPCARLHPLTNTIRLVIDPSFIGHQISDRCNAIGLYQPTASNNH